MMLSLLKSKLHRATVTETNLDYEGSIVIDADLMKAANILQHERVDVYNITNGDRFVTYAITGEGGSGKVSIQGAAAHRAKPGDLVIICTYAEMTEDEAAEWKPAVVLLDHQNTIKK